MNVVQTDRELVRRAAEYLAQVNAESEPAVREVYWFPSDNEIRLVEVDETLPPRMQEEAVAPFYFRPDPVGGIPYQMAIALVGTQDPQQAGLPEGWGGWDDAMVIWRRA